GAPTRYADVDLVVALCGQRLCKQFALLDVAGQEDEARTRLVVVELREKCAQHLAKAERPVGAGEIGAVTPILAGAKEERLDAEEAAVLEDREYICLFDVTRVDVLARLHGCQRRQPVAQHRGALKIERLGRAVHFACQFFSHDTALARQERLRLTHQLLIDGTRYLVRAWRRAALDLVKQAWPGTAVEHRIRTGADQEGALQRRDGPIHCIDGRERPKIVARAIARATMLQDLRRP